ncbi:MAG TPA: hypothetical protein VNB06_03745 [Thermoanaerobaculia bacterium]|nr:hypothetical protein [Thermoanaerobaculia bacterium]
MLLTFAAFLGLSLAFFGLGKSLWWGLARVTALPHGQPLWGELGLLGLFGFGIAAVLWNFLLPVTSAFAWLMLALGLVVLVASSLRKAQRRSLARIAVPGVVSAGALAVLVGFTPLGYDAGLYHLPAQLWARSGPAVMGLSNFHNRLGLNSILEPISAALWLPGNLILVGVVDALFLLFYLLSLVQFLREDPGRGMPVSVAFAVLSPLSLLLFNSYFLFQVGLNDVPAAMVVLACLFAFVRANETGGDLRGALIPLSTLFVLAAFAITIKLSSVSVAVLPGMALLTFSSGVPSRRQWVALCLASGALALPALVQGAWLSGCLLFPVAGTCLDPLPWSNRGEAELTTAAITAWARAPGTGLEYAQGWAWLPDWWERNRVELTRILIVTVVASVTAFGLRFALRRVAPRTEISGSRATRASTSAGVVLFCLASLALWFVRAPHPRFGSAALHALTITPGLLIFASRAGAPRLERKVWRVVGIGGAVLVSLFSIELAARAWPRSVDRSTLLSFRLGTPTVEVVPNEHFGVRPREGDQCWLTRSPCSPHDREISVGRRGPWMIMEPLSRTE